jgi:hypothetical protein
MKNPREISIVSIRLTEYDRFDLDKILKAIGSDIVSKLFWGLTNLEYVTFENTDYLFAQSEKPQHDKLVISGSELLKFSNVAIQVIEGIFIGYPSRGQVREFLRNDWSLSQFAESSAIVAIKAIDGSWFDVYLSSRVYFHNLQEHFKEMCIEDLSKFLSSYNGG